MSSTEDLANIEALYHPWHRGNLSPEEPAYDDTTGQIDDLSVRGGGGGIAGRPGVRASPEETACDATDDKIDDLRGGRGGGGRERGEGRERGGRRGGGRAGRAGVRASPEEPACDATDDKIDDLRDGGGRGGRRGRRRGGGIVERACVRASPKMPACDATDDKIDDLRGGRRGGGRRRGGIAERACVRTCPEEPACDATTGRFDVLVGRGAGGKRGIAGRSGVRASPEEPAWDSTADKIDDLRDGGGRRGGGIAERTCLRTRPEESTCDDTTGKFDVVVGRGGDDIPLVRDFVSLNRILKPPGHRRIRQPLQYVYTRFGDKKPLPDDARPRRKRYRTKSQQIQSTSKSPKDAETDAVVPSSKADQLELVSPVSRHKIVCGLKANWSCLNTQYQRLPIINDTRWRQQRKEDLERRLTQLEHDIQLMEMCKHLYTL